MMTEIVEKLEEVIFHDDVLKSMPLNEFWSKYHMLIKEREGL